MKTKINTIIKFGLLAALGIFLAAAVPLAGCAYHRHNEPSVTEAPKTDAAGTPVTEAPKTDAAGTPAAELPKTNPAPDFTVKNADGEKVTLSSLFGKPIVLNFWATWCPPCRMELPDFEKIYKSYGDKVQFMMINIEGGGKKAENAKQFTANAGFTFPLYFDTTAAAAAAYGISVIPASFFIDASGNIVSCHEGMMNAKQLEKEIRKLLP